MLFNLHFRQVFYSFIPFSTVFDKTVFDVKNAMLSKTLIKKHRFLLHTERNSFMASVSNQTESFPEKFSSKFSLHFLLIGTVLFLCFIIIFYSSLMPGQFQKGKISKKVFIFNGFLIKSFVMRFPFDKLRWFDDVCWGWNRWTNKIIIIRKSTDSTRLLCVCCAGNYNIVTSFISLVVFRIKSTT